MMEESTRSERIMRLDTYLSIRKILMIQKERTGRNSIDKLIISIAVINAKSLNNESFKMDLAKKIDNYQKTELVDKHRNWITGFFTKFIKIKTKSRREIEEIVTEINKVKYSNSVSNP